MEQTVEGLRSGELSVSAFHSGGGRSGTAVRSGTISGRSGELEFGFNFSVLSRFAPKGPNQTFYTSFVKCEGCGRSDGVHEESCRVLP